ncbi:hypothetical protein TWF696_005776 [Orbilia brochopaga]|uniref:Uncharacterized protein n=1 Tax=Orbilia brochopaga TaxID=3140254 RepID=A0AAV9UY79_9PEZI
MSPDEDDKIHYSQSSIFISATFLSVFCVYRRALCRYIRERNFGLLPFGFRIDQKRKRKYGKNIACTPQIPKNPSRTTEWHLIHYTFQCNLQTRSGDVPFDTSKARTCRALEARDSQPSAS